MVRDLFAPALIAACVTSVVMPAHAGTVAVFSLPTGEYKAPLPDGYCTPTGTYEAQAKITAAADTTNLTDISFYLCDEMASKRDVTTWGMIKTPLETLNEKTPSRAELIAALKSQIDADEYKKLTAEAIQEALPQAQTIFGKDIKVGLDAKAVDSDAAGIYFAGTSMASDGTTTNTSAVAYAVTASAGNVFMIYLFGPYHGAKDVLAVLAKVKTATSDFVNTNGG